MQSLFLPPEEILKWKEPHIFHAFIDFKMKQISSLRLLLSIRDAIQFKLKDNGEEIDERKLFEKAFEVYDLLTK